MDYPQIAPGYKPWPDVPARRAYYDPMPAVPMEKPDSVTLDQLLQPLRRRHKLVLLCALAGMVLALLLAAPQKPVYQARALVEVQAYNENYLNMGAVDPRQGERVGIEGPYVQTQIKLLQSDTLIERVANKLHLEQRGDFRDSPSRLTSWMRKLHLAPVPLPGREQFIRQVAAGLTVRPVGETRIVEVLYESQDPKLASDFANALVNEFVDLSLERRIDSSQQTGRFLAGQIREMRANLESSEQQLQAYARQAGLIFTPSDKDSVAEAKLRQLQDALSKAQEDRVAAEARYERASNSPAEALPEVLEDATLRSYDARLTELKRQLAELSATYTPNYYKVKETRAQIAEYEKALVEGRGNILKRVRNQYQASLSREKALGAMYAQQTGTVTTQSEKAVRYNMLKREVDTNRQIYDAMLQRVKEAGIASGIRASSVQVVDQAKTPQLPVRPSVPLYAGVGLLAGMFAGMGYAFMRRRGDATMQAPGDASFHLRFPELGAIPDAVQLQPVGFPRLLRARTATAETDRLELVSWRDKHSPLAESFRAALASVLFSGPRGEWPRAVVITSSTPGEGKTVVASNFAIALAETNHRVLLLDGDLRRPRLHDVFSLQSEKGFADLLRDTAPCKNYPAEVLGQKTEVPGLYVLPAGTESAGAANLLYSPRAAELLQRLRREFHAIVIDTAPLSLLADARGLARLADGVAFVVRADRTSPEIASAALRRLSEDGTVVLGTILNSWDTRKTSGRQYTQYT